MDPVRLGVVLDSSIAIDAEREHLDVASFLKKIAARTGEREACIWGITVPAVRIGRSAVDQRFQGRGLGAGSNEF